MDLTTDHNERLPLTAAARTTMEALSEYGITADRDGMHVLPPEQLHQSVTMQEECKEFLSKTKQFNNIVADFITVMESKSR